MKNRTQPASAGKMIILLLVLLNVIFLRSGYSLHVGFYWPMLITVPLLGFVWYKSAQ